MTRRSERDLGMGRRISRRDFLNGVGVAVTGSMLPTSALEVLRPAHAAVQREAAGYPPIRTGMRGSHPGSFEVAHALVEGKTWEEATDTRETYDLIVVGGGISGLSAAYFFRKTLGGPRSRVLVLDNHDDFGGHATRNEFWHDGRMYLMNGGTLNVEAPSQYSAVAAGLLWDIGIDRTRYYEAIKGVADRYGNLGLTRGMFFDKETFGEDRLVAGYGRHPWPDFLAATPLAEKARHDIAHLYDDGWGTDQWPGVAFDEKRARLARMSYRDYLLEVIGVHPQVVSFFNSRSMGLFCTGIDALPALYAWEMGYPGFQGLGLEPTPPDQLINEPGGQHGRENNVRAQRGCPDMYFPDGNSTIARLLVRGLHPHAVPGKSMEDVVTARVNYGRLDDPNWPVRIRLNSTAVKVHHRGSLASAREVEVTYVNAGRAYRASGQACVLACWNGVIPYLCPELPERQREALAYGVKAPIVYTSVLLSNWTAFVESRVSNVTAPGSYHPSLGLGPSLSLGDYRTSQEPDQPIVVRMSRYPCKPGLSRREQHRAGRQELLSTTFETFERNIRDQLTQMFSPAGFDPARDILAITVNRWPHGYAYTYNTLFDPVNWALSTPADRPAIVGRQPLGRIAIANSDAAASPHTDAAINEAYRAVEELRALLT